MPQSVWQYTNQTRTKQLQLYSLELIHCRYIGGNPAIHRQGNTRRIRVGRTENGTKIRLLRSTQRRILVKPLNGWIFGIAQYRASLFPVMIRGAGGRSCLIAKETPIGVGQIATIDQTGSSGKVAARHVTKGRQLTECIIRLIPTCKNIHHI